MKRARLAVWMLLALVLPAMLWMACTLNPQPIPPGAELDGSLNGGGQGRGDSAVPGADMDASETSEGGPDADAGDADADAGDADAGDADAG
ncbi:hypothetical protein LZC95_47275 [Pendulispora brunnea]|uniref:Uncharacterized protein n=1 Tax=Pendulispora brunnea TaxID=2905690 RepID=A0ABZ2K9M3_9BACT